MSGLLRRLKRRRPATADENRSLTAASSEPAAAPAETPAEPGGQPPLSADQAAVSAEQPTQALPATTEQPAAAQPLPAWTIAADQPTAFAAQPAPARDLPAGVDPGDLAAAPAASARRGKLRRRLRYLRHVRELLLRDLGGFTYEVHRTAGGTAQEPHRRLAAAKAERLSALDAEVLALETRLGEPHAGALLREPGIGGTCPECGELHASDAHFCSRCGAPLDEKARARRAAAEQPAEAPPTTGSHAVAEPQPASVLWAGGPRPAPAAEEKKPAPEPLSAVTSEWLATDQPTTFERPPQPDEAEQAEAPAAQADEPAAPKAESATAEDAPPATAEDAPPATADEPAEPAEPAEPEPVAPAKPKRVTKPRKRAPAKPRAAKPAPQTHAAQTSEPETPEPKPEAENPEPETRSFEANGRRDEDVPPPISSGDPLATPREQGS